MRILSCPFCGEDHPIPGINMHVLGKHRDRYPEFLAGYQDFKQSARVYEVPPAPEDRPRPTGIPPSPRDPGHVEPAGDALDTMLLPVLAMASATSAHKSGGRMLEVVIWGVVLLFFLWLLYHIFQERRPAPAPAGEHTATPAAVPTSVPNMWV